MKRMIFPFLGNVLVILFVLFGNISIAQSASDQASNYSGAWNNGSNFGTGFGAWALTAGANSGVFIGNPSSNGMSTTLTGTTAFGMFANGSAYVNASRNITTAMAVGDAFSFHWAVNWDASTGSKGFDFKAAGITVYNVNMAGSSTITAGGVNAQTAYGTNNMIVTMARISTTQYTFSLSARDGVSSIYTATVNISSAIDNINFYIGNQNDFSANNGNRNMYFNNLRMYKLAFRSNVATGSWGTAGSWQQSPDNGTTWMTATTTPNSSFGTIQILNGHNITSTTVTADQLTVEAGGILTVPSGITLTIANGADAIDCSVLGTVINSGAITPTGNITAGSTGVYQHAQNGATIPATTWTTGSECKITGVLGTMPGGITQSFHHLTWDCPGQNAAVNLSGNLATVNGNFKVWNTGNNELRGCATTAAAITVNGDVIIGGNTLGNSSTFNLCSGTSASAILYIRGNLTINAGALACSNVSGTRQIYFDSSTGNIQDLSVASTATGITGSIDFFVSNSNGSKVRLLTDVTLTGGFEVSTGGTMDFQTFALKGTQTTGKVFTAATGSNLITANTNATGSFNTTGANGSVQLTGSRTFTAAHFTFNGNSPQKTGNGVTNIGNLTINNVGSTVALTNACTMSGVLTLTNGKLLLGANNLIMSNNSPSLIVGGSSTSHVVTGDPFDASPTYGLLSRAITTTTFPAVYLFPVGNNSGYQPMTLTFTSNTVARAVTVYAMNGTEPSVSSSPSYLSNRYWITGLSIATGTYSYNSQFEFPASDVVGGFASLKLYNAMASWTDAGSSATSTSVTSSGLTNATAPLSGQATWTAKGTSSGASPQSITFGPLSAVTYGASAFSLNATASSGLAVTYTSSNTAVATVSGNTVTIVGAGTTTITASQSGDASYSAATPVTQSLVVNPKSLTVSGAVAQNKVYDGNNTASITGASLVGVVGSDVVTLTSAGTFNSVNVGTGIGITPNFSIAGAQSGNYTLTQPSGLSANITQASQTITFGTLAAVSYGGANFNLTATASSGLTVSYSSSNTAVATISGNTVTIVGVGTTTITASQAGNTNYAAATNVTQTLTVNQASQTITFGALANKTITDAPYTITATASSGLTVSFSSSNTAVATVSGNTITIVGAGTTNITASQAGNTNYLAATNVVQSLTVSVPSLVWFDANALSNFGPSPFTASTATNVASTGLIRSAAVATTGTAAASRGWGGLNWSNSSTPDLTATSFITFNANVAVGYKMNLMEIAPFGYRRSLTGPTNAVLQYSMDGINYTTITTLAFPSTSTSGASLSAIDLTGISALQNLTNCSTVTFKIIPYGASSNLGTFYIFDVLNTTASDLALNGVVSALTSSPLVSISSSDADLIICSGQSVTYTATATAATTIAYQWKKDGVSIAGATSSTYTTTTLTSGNITCDINACGQTSSSNAIYTTVMGTPSMTFSAGGGSSVCSGTTPTFNATGANTYQFFLNGTAQGAPSSSSTYTPTTALSTGDQICVRGYNALPFTIDGDLSDPYWGAPLANSNGGPASSGFGANRLDALYLRNGMGYLFGGIAGSLQNNSGNKVLLFIDCNAGGYNNLSSWIYRSNTPYYSMQNLNGGIQFDSGFEPDYIMGINIASNVLYFDLYNMQTNVNSYLGASNTGTLYAYQSNTGTGDFSKGFEFSIPMNLLGIPSGSIKVMAMLVNDPGVASATFLSNQFLTPANNGEGNYGSGAVNFGAAAPNPASYGVIQDCYSEQCLTVSQSLTPSVSIASSDADNSICAGTSVTFTATPTNGGTTPSYQWKLNGNNVGTNATTYSNSALANNDVVTVVMTANNTCQTSATANGNSITTSVISNVTPSVAVTSGDADNSICVGTNVTFTATPTNGGTTPSYQWKLNGNSVGTDATTYSNSALANNDVVTVVMTANNTCQTSATANGNSITTSVISIVTPGVAVASSDTDNSICDGTSVTFTATPTNGGTTPSYQWKLNGNNVGTDATTYSNSALANNDVVTVVMTANNTCQSTATANGNSITTSVISNVTPSVVIASSDSDNSICAGTSVTFTATPTNGGTSPSYQWKLNGNNVGTDATTYSISALANNDVVTVVMTANNTCQTSATANGNSITTSVISNVTPSVAVTSDDADNSICSGTSVTFTATPTNGGTTPSYQWKLNGNSVGTDATTYSNSALANNDVVTVVMTANNTCQSTATANGNSITTSVISNVTPSVVIASSDSDNSICAGTSVTFTATPTNGGTSPSYQWKLNGNNVGTDATTYSISALANNDVVTVLMTANNTCQTSATANGSSITTSVISNVTPSVSITSNTTDICPGAGSSVTFNALPTNGGSTPSYQWKRNGTNVGTNSSSYSSSALSGGDVITVTMTASNACQTSNTVSSAGITMNALSVSTFYLDNDADGYGQTSSGVQDCSQPTGYIAQGGDCNDSDSGINPGAIEICNGMDDNCNGQSEEGLIFLNFYLDNDGDGYGATSSIQSACDVIGGYILSGGDCNDANININPGATELCSNIIDDDCDGLINEVCVPGNDNPQYASNAVPSVNITSCNTYTGTLLACTPSPAMTGSWTSGPDVWYYFTANGPGVTIRCIPVANDVALELRTYSGDLLKTANAVAGVSDEYLNYGNLNIGQQYYIRVRNANASQVGGNFSLCLRRLTSSGNLNYTNTIIYDSGCDIVYATNTTGSTSCTIQLTPISPAGGPALFGEGSTVTLANFTGLNGEKVQYNTLYSATINLTYALPIGGGGTENLVISRVADNQLNVVSHMDINLSSLYECPTKVSLGALVRATPWLCDAVKYQWKFERMLNGVPYLSNGNPVVIEAFGPNGLRDFYLLGSLGFAAGTEWRVQVRPIFANGVVGSYGTNYQCMIFRGTLAAMPTVGEEEEIIQEKNLDALANDPVLYPNPSRTGEFRIDWLNQDDVETSLEIWDAQGRKVGTWQWTEINTHLVNGNHWESGVYQIKITRGKTTHWLRWMKL